MSVALKSIQRLYIKHNGSKICHYRDALMAMYTDLAKLTEDLVATNTIRQRTFQEIHKSLDGINEMLKAASKLRGNSEDISPHLVIFNLYVEF